MFLTLYLYDSDGCHVGYLYDNQQLTAAMWVICMTTNSNGCHMDYLKKYLAHGRHQLSRPMQIVEPIQI